jgi:hypothetical protein
MTAQRKGTVDLYGHRYLNNYIIDTNSNAYLQSDNGKTKMDIRIFTDDSLCIGIRRIDGIRSDSLDY